MWWTILQTLGAAIAMPAIHAASSLVPVTYQPLVQAVVSSLAAVGLLHAPSPSQQGKL